MIPNRSF